jgi:putative inorganic carbon (HCO3(-)) transporter
MVAGLTIYFYLQGKLKRRKGIIFALLIALLLIAASRSIAHKQHTQPIFSTIMRWNYWKDTLAIIKAFPLTGVGLGNFNLTQSRFAHNSYLQIFAEMGILGIISFLWLVISVLNRGLKTLNGPCDKTQVSALIAAATIFLIHNLVDFTFFLPEVALIWWVVLGLIVPGD